MIPGDLILLLALPTVALLLAEVARLQRANTRILREYRDSLQRSATSLALFTLHTARELHRDPRAFGGWTEEREAKFRAAVEDARKLGMDLSGLGLEPGNAPVPARHPGRTVH